MEVVRSAYQAPVTRLVEPTAPEPSWSGKPVFELSRQEIRELCSWAETAGEAAADMARENPFHPAFLGGVPQVLWSMGYRRRQREGQCGRAVLLGA
jgi:hypothetical protein